MDEEDPESQESHGWLESGRTPLKGPTNVHESGPSNYQGKKAQWECGVDANIITS